MILSTGVGERINNPAFGSVLPNILFSTINESAGEKILNSCVDAINRWEDRITVIDSACRLKIIQDENAIIVIIAYQLKKDGTVSKYISKVSQ